MGLITPSLTFAAPQNNFSATPSISAGGTVLTASATPHAKGAWTEIFAATNFDVWGISLHNFNDASSGAQANILLDIGVGGAGSESAIVSNMVLAGAGSGTSTPKTYFLPVNIPRNTRVSARIQALTTVDVTNIVMVLQGGPSAAPGPVFAGADCIGADTATSGGLSHTAGSSAAESAWTDIGSPTARQYYALLPVIQPGSDTSMISTTYHVEIGYASTTLGEWAFFTDSAENLFFVIPYMPTIIEIPAGTQLQVRAECQGTAEPLQYGILAFY